MPKIKVIHFSWMNAYWSCPPGIWEELQKRIRRNQGFDLYMMGCRELRFRPTGQIFQLVDVERRQER